ncbi:hypothetical protein QYM36_017649, partial [Artemia franciscana]
VEVVFRCTVMWWIMVDVFYFFSFIFVRFQFVHPIWNPFLGSIWAILSYKLLGQNVQQFLDQGQQRFQAIQLFLLRMTILASGVTATVYWFIVGGYSGELPTYDNERRIANLHRGNLYYYHVSIIYSIIHMAWMKASVWPIPDVRNHRFTPTFWKLFTLMDGAVILKRYWVISNGSLFGNSNLDFLWTIYYIFRRCYDI